MMWITALIAVACLAIGAVLGLVYASRLGNSPSRVQELEARIRELKNEQDGYRANVSEHFNTTAELVQQMSDNYREVYRHLALGARDLCSPDVAGKLPPPEDGIIIEDAPKDYAARQGPDQRGALSEEFGISPITPGTPGNSVTPGSPNAADAPASPQKSEAD